MEVLDFLLPNHVPGARKLLEQARQAPYVLRQLVGKSGYMATIPYVEDSSLLVELDDDIESPTVQLIDANSGRKLHFSTAVSRGGFLFGLRGITYDGARWPKKWQVGSPITCSTDPALWLGPLQCTAELDVTILNALIAWCGANPELVYKQRDILRLRRPASDRDIANCESRLKISLPDMYKEFVKICNGFSIYRGRPYEMLGTRDIDYLDDLWLGITPLYEEGYVAFRRCEDITKCDCYLLQPHRSPVMIGDLRQHVRESLEWDCG